MRNATLSLLISLCYVIAADKVIENFEHNGNLPVTSWPNCCGWMVSPLGDQLVPSESNQYKCDGQYSMKLVIPDAQYTGISKLYQNPVLNFTGYDAIRIWVWSDTARSMDLWLEEEWSSGREIWSKALALHKGPGNWYTYPLSPAFFGNGNDPDDGRINVDNIFEICFFFTAVPGYPRSGTVYIDRIEAINLARIEADSAPSDLQAVSSTSNSISLSWTDNSHTETGFRIERAAEGDTFKLAGSVMRNVTTFTARSLLAGTGYRFRIRASNPKGDSPPSNEIAVVPGGTTAAQTRGGDALKAGGESAGRAVDLAGRRLAMQKAGGAGVAMSIWRTRSRSPGTRYRWTISIIMSARACLARLYPSRSDVRSEIHG